MDRFVFIHTMQAIGLLLAANACANLSAIDTPMVRKILEWIGINCLVAGLVALICLAAVG